MNAPELLQDLLRARTINPPGDEHVAADIVDAYLSDAGLQTRIVVSPNGRANLVARVEGPHDRPALVLLSHSDVVPVEEERWTHDPFGGEVHDGFIWGRGALDMKGIAVMHAVAAAELARSSATPARELVVAMVADEEAGGAEGARWLVDEHADLVGLGDGRPLPEVLGEGAFGVTGVLDRPVMPTALGEKTAVWFEITADGDPGHGALPPQRQAVVSLSALVQELSGLGAARVHPVMREQFATLAAVASGTTAAIFRALASPAGAAVARAVAPRLRKAGAVGLLLSDSVTPTQLEAGYKSNVVPAEARASFDARLLPDTDPDEFLTSVEKRARRHSARMSKVGKKERGPVSERGPLYEILEQTMRTRLPNVITTISLSPAITDLRFFRARGATAYGWCPLVLTPEMLATIHGHDERVSVRDLDAAVAATCDVVASACS